MQNKTYGMFTDNGNFMVHRIVEAAQSLVQQGDAQSQAWAFAYRELHKLGTTDEFGESTDTDVREQVYDAIVTDHNVPFYI